MRSTLPFLLVLFSLSAECNTPQSAPAPSIKAATVTTVADPVKANTTVPSPGTKKTICPQTVPDGWVIVDTPTCASCCGITGLSYQIVIMDIQGFPKGKRIVVCNTQPTPKGWITVGEVGRCSCCEFGANGQMGYTKTIEKL